MDILQHEVDTVRHEAGREKWCWGWGGIRREGMGNTFDPCMLDACTKVSNVKKVNKNIATIVNTILSFLNRI